VVSTLLYLASKNNLNLSTRTLGVIGVGNVGKRVSRVAEELGMEVLKNDPPRRRMEGGTEFTDLDYLLTQADIITLHVPLNRGGTDNTFQMVNTAFLDKIKEGAILINTSRGEVMNETALLDGIRREKPAEVVLDVYENEPHINTNLLGAVTLATPHIAGYSMDGKANGTTMSVQAISHYFNLGMNDWIPSGIPVPPVSELYSDASVGNRSDLLWELYRQTYDISADDRHLREEPGRFEELRGNYPLRREPVAYAVRLLNGTREIRKQLKKLGFSVLSDSGN